MSLKSRKQRPMAEINITPFTDVVLVLLIIFMVATPLILQSSIKVNLPNASSSSENNNWDQVDITIGSNNMIYLNNKEVTEDELKEKITRIREINPEVKIILFSDKFVQFNNIVAVLDIMNGLGIKHLNIATTTGPVAERS